MATLWGHNERYEGMPVSCTLGVGSPVSPSILPWSLDHALMSTDGRTGKVGTGSCKVQRSELQVQSQEPCILILALPPTV